MAAAVDLGGGSREGVLMERGSPESARAPRGKSTGLERLKTSAMEARQA